MWQCSVCKGWKQDGTFCFHLGAMLPEPEPGLFDVHVDPVEIRKIREKLEKQRMNNKYKIRVAAPLLRPGIVIETEVSERYVVPVLQKIMELVREFNAPKEAGK